jgi:hypothetical protein
MQWIKKGLVFCPAGEPQWALHSALTPTPFILNNDIIRIYAGFRDAKGVSRVGYADLDAHDPTKVVHVSATPALDIGEAGMFDDNGVILGDVIRVGERILMYFIGFQLPQKAKFLAFTGLAESFDGGNSFQRLQKTPVMDRADEGTLFRAIHSVMLEKGLYRAWYGVGSEWTTIDGVPYPNYLVRYTESPDGLTFPRTGSICIDRQGAEYRIGRPRVYRMNGKYVMFYTKGTVHKDYLPGYAESDDGINWTRKDADVGIGPSAEGWDSKTLSYCALASCHGRTYMFYNGNDMGRDGFGCAELVAT